MKGLATETIVLLILALIVLGILGGLIFIGGGPFRTAAEYNACKGRLTQWCLTGEEDAAGENYKNALGGSASNCFKINWVKSGFKDIFPDECGDEKACCDEVT